MVHLVLLIIYISFISLGLPDGLLGAAWPSIQPQLRVPVSWMGPVSLIISGGTVISSLLTDWITKKFGTHRVTAYSVAMTAAALIGFAFSNQYWMLCLWAIPYGLGAGSVDACLNNYVAIHYSGKHMSWLHCMWGVGAAAGPYIMGMVLTGGQSWGHGYLYIGIFQIILTVCLFMSLPVWKTAGKKTQSSENHKSLSFKQLVCLPKAMPVFLAFFCYCALEQTLGQWSASYFYGHLHLSEELSASLAGLYYLGITIGRAINGFLTVSFSDKSLIRFGITGILMGIACMLLPFGFWSAVIGVILVGLGSAPIYPCIIHSTPVLFGAENSQGIIGIEMASAYIGTCLMPPIFGMIADWIGLWTLPVVLLVISLMMMVCHERLYVHKTQR